MSARRPAPSILIDDEAWDRADEAELEALVEMCLALRRQGVCMVRLVPGTQEPFLYNILNRLVLFGQAAAIEAFGREACRVIASRVAWTYTGDVTSAALRQMRGMAAAGCDVVIISRDVYAVMAEPYRVLTLDVLSGSSLRLAAAFVGKGDALSPEQDACRA